MEERIDEQSFIRISNSHIINLSFIAECRRDERRLIIMLDDGQEFYVSRRRVGNFRELMSKSPKAILLRKNKRKS
jgi:DNA-binding LytR/AlgR family response regulator